MAYVKVSTTKNAIAALRYGEHEESVVRGGVDCPDDTETACRLFMADRIIWNKYSGLQAHVIIQSFDGQETTPEQANQIGQELAKRVAPGHRAMVYSHKESEGGNIHNHIVICAINQDTGKKLDTHGMLQKCRNASDELAREHGLSIIQGKSAEIRYTQAERGIVAKGGVSWKDNIRDIVDHAKMTSKSLAEFRQELQEQGITVHERGSKQTESGKQWTYCTEHEGKQVKVRAAKLGEAYTLESVSKAVSRERVSALDRVQQIQQGGKSATEKAQSIISATVSKAQEQDRATELARQKTKSRKIDSGRGFSR